MNDAARQIYDRNGPSVPLPAQFSRTKEECQRTAISVMRQKGVAFAEENAMRWRRGDFADDEESRKLGYQDWLNIKQCIQEFCSQLNRQLKAKG